MTATDTSQWVVATGFAAPVISGAIYLIIVSLFLTQNRGRQPERKLALLLMMELCTYALGWCGMIIYTVDSVLYMYIEVPFRFCILCAPVITYHLVFTLTRTGVKERFNPVNYIIPAIIALVLLVWSRFVPDSVRLSIIESRGESPAGYEVYTFMATMNRRLFPLYSILYSVLGLRRIIRFKQALANYSADEGRSSIGWLRMLICITLATIPMASTPALLGVGRMFGSIITLLAALPVMFKDLLLVYNIIAQNYVTIEHFDEDEQAVENGEHSPIMQENGLTTGKLDSFMSKRKPYLNPKLRIVDLAQGLNTNRTYLSGFINREYGMNFSRYINRYRLQELEKLRVAPAYSGMSGMELVQKAGFSNFRGYLRAKKLEDMETTLSD